MNKKLIFVISIIFLLIIAGCNGGSRRDRPITDIDVRKGIEGLTMKFVQNAPPERVFEGSIENPSLFPIAVELRNKGAFSIGDDKNTPEIMKEKGILVFGFEKAYVDFDEESKKKLIDGKLKFVIEGKSIFNPVGDEEFITINALAKKIGAQSETHTSTILATVCYPYKTVFGSSVCVDPDVYGIEKRQKVCSVQDLVFGGGQGAPVAVTKIETRMLPYTDAEGVNKVKPHFIIYIENKGNGEVIDLNKVETACTEESLKYTDFNNITIKATLSGKPLDCGGGKEPAVIRLRDKEDVVRCTLEDGIDASDAYTAPLRIELDYGYTFTISKDIIIEKILTY